MNKRELIKVFGERFKQSDTEAVNFVNVFFDRIRQALIDGDRVEIRGFGSFAMKATPVETLRVVTQSQWYRNGCRSSEQVYG